MEFDKILTPYLMMTTITLPRLIFFSGILLCFQTAVIAQQSLPDSSIHQPVQAAGDSLFTHFTGSVNLANSIGLQWEAVGTTEGEYFIVERSNDDSDFETAGVLKITGNSGTYALTDTPPLNGIHFYRIKYNRKSGELIYSKIIQVNLSANVDFKFYPNPVDKLLIIQTGHDVQIQILDGQGGIKLTKEISPGIQVINVSTLEKGNYVMKVEDQQSNKSVSEQLLKN